MAGAYIFGIFISKLSHRQESRLVIFFKIEKNLKINLYGVFLLLSLAITLRMKSG